ncbi:MAG: DUF2914 domain-containing protein [Bdellovibrionota bacterium]
MKPPSLELVRYWLRRYHHWTPLGAFVAGFLFDIVSLGRIDSWDTIAQQVLYLLICSALVGKELVDSLSVIGEVGAAEDLNRAAAFFQRHRFTIAHFFLGSLLSSFTLFFFKSASALSSLVFVVVLSGLLVLNELTPMEKRPVLVRLFLLYLCYTCFLIYLVPMILGRLGLFPFLLALSAAFGVGVAHYYALRRWLPAGPATGLRNFILPNGVIGGAFLILYLLELIPPIPLSAQYLGIFHDVRKTDGRYELVSQRPWWRFWHRGDQLYFQRPGDKLFVFARIFSPTRFHDTVKIRWLKHEEKHGYVGQDAIPIEIAGGRTEGFRGYAFKNNFSPGHWRVKIETVDGREIGRIGFEVRAAAIGESTAVPLERIEIQ